MTATVIDKITAVFSAVLSWIIQSVNDVVDIFYVDGDLTVIGVLSIVGVSIAIFTLVVSIVRGFFHLS